LTTIRLPATFSVRSCSRTCETNERSLVTIRLVESSMSRFLRLPVGESGGELCLGQTDDVLNASDRAIAMNSEELRDQSNDGRLSCSIRPLSPLYCRWEGVISLMDNIRVNPQIKIDFCQNFEDVVFAQHHGFQVCCCPSLDRLPTPRRKRCGYLGISPNDAS